MRRLARVVKARLRHSVVLLSEPEDNSISRIGVDIMRRVEEFVGSSNGDMMSFSTSSIPFWGSADDSGQQHGHQSKEERESVNHGEVRKE